MKKRVYGPPETKYQVDPTTGCWIWLGYKNKKGYGYFTVKYSKTLSVTKRAHIYFYEKKYGKVPPGLELDHIICDNKGCCNPDHVEPVTGKINIRRYWRQKNVSPPK